MTALLLLQAPAAYALSTDKDQPIHIEADSVVMDDSQGVAVYRGNVRYVQGSARLMAEEITIYSADRHKVDKTVAVGHPATFRQRPDNKDEDMEGQAARIEYYAAEERIILEQDAHLRQGKDEFSGSRIEYDTANETVKAHKAGDEAQRVQVIIQPRKQTGEHPPSAPVAKP